MLTSEQYLTAIVAPPPTPNGDLHVGHLSGPYLGVDILRRYLKMQGKPVVTALGVDVHQSYVVTTAERLKKNHIELAQTSHGDVKKTLGVAGIKFDVVGMPDGAYRDYVSDWFRRLSEAGLFEYRQREIPFDIARNRFMFESYASGWCPTCLSATNANICEDCGHPNEAGNLLGLYPTGGQPGDPIENRLIGEYVLDLEKFREPLQRYLNDKIAEKRPALSRLISELFASKLPCFPVTFPSSWGIEAPFPDADGLVLNVWAEMVPGHYYWIEQGARNSGTLEQYRLFEGEGAQGEYVQYLGFDNSFFYTIAHLALAIAAKEAGVPCLMPTAFVTNEFYLLENFKFSTSQGHLIWGRDLFNELPADEVRFYLCWSNPEYNQTNFTIDDMECIVRTKFRQPFRELIHALSRLPSGDSSFYNNYVSALRSRFKAAYNPERQSLRLAAKTIANGLTLCIALSKNKIAPEIIRGVSKTLAQGLYPICPAASKELWESVGAVGEVKWSDK